MKRELVAVGIEEHRIDVVTPSLSGFRHGEAPEDHRSILFVGRLVEAKGVWDAVEAWKRSGVELPLVFAGTGPLRNELEARGFEVLGWFPREHMASLYRSAAAVLMPSRWQEPFGIAGLEAQSLGTPVVAWTAAVSGSGIAARDWWPGVMSMASPASSGPWLKVRNTEDPEASDSAHARDTRSSARALFRNGG